LSPSFRPSTHHPKLIPEKYEIIEDNTVKVSLRTNAGRLVIYTMDFAMMIEGINMATRLLNSAPAKFIEAVSA